MGKPVIFYADDEEWEAVARTVWRLNPHMHWAHKDKGGAEDVVRDMKQSGASSASKNTTLVGTDGGEVNIHRVKGGYYLRPSVATHLIDDCVRKA